MRLEKPEVAASNREPERTILKASVKDAAGQHVAQVEKAVVRTVEFETARANVVRQSQALDEMHRKVVQETLPPLLHAPSVEWPGPGQKRKKKVPAQRAWCAGV